jgi:hypothetical protein
LYATLGIIGASAIAVVACTSNTTINNGADDGGTTDAAASSDDAGGDTGTSTPTPDTGTPPATDSGGGDGGVVCDTAGQTDACALCALQMCCSAENQCQSVEPVGDGGTTECQDIFSCVQDLITPAADSGVDAGMSLSDATTSCSAGHSSTATTDFNALSACLTSMCATQCQ